MDKSLLQQFLDAAGLTLAAGIASLFGAIAGLAFAQKVTPRQAIIIVFAGIGMGSFGSAGLVTYWQLNAGVAGALAFFLAVLAMPLLGLMFAMVSRLRDRAPTLADRAADKVLPPPAPPPAEPEAKP